MIWMYKIAVNKKEMLLEVAKFKYSQFFEGKSLMTFHKRCTNVMYVTLYLKTKNWKRLLMSKVQSQY